MTPGLADALDGDPFGVDLGQGGEFRNCAVEIVDGFHVLERVAGVAAVQRLLVGMLVEKVRRDADEAVAGESLGKIAGVLNQSITLVHEHDRRNPAPTGTGRHGQKCR